MTSPRYATLCSGVEAVSLAWEPLGMSPVFFCDNAGFPTRFLAERFPQVPNLGDMLVARGEPWRGKVDVLWASFPCQDFSEAGKRRGVAGARGALTLAGVELVDAIDPPVFCFENVKGLLSDGKNAFGQFLGRLAGEDVALVPPGGGWTHSGYVLGPKRKIAWRLLDAQYFGLPQQRERLFLVACPSDGADPRRILFEPGPVPDIADERARSRQDAGRAATGMPLATAIAIRGRKHDGVEIQQIEEGGVVSYCLRASQGGSDKAMVFVCDADPRNDVVRLLTPVECERCQGMPDDWTLIDGASDSVRYHAIGNSLPVPVVRWLGERILQEVSL